MFRQVSTSPASRSATGITAWRRKSVSGNYREQDSVLTELSGLGIATRPPLKSVKQGRPMVERSGDEREQLARWEGEKLHGQMEMTPVGRF
jgi:hypothetical protein